jgi:tetratricopeptide (TPR) repeat protein
MPDPANKGDRLAALALAGLLAPGFSAAAADRKHKPAPAPAPKTAVEANATREIRNAIDAGDGDITLRDLRQKLAAEPSNLSTRLALASAYEHQGAVELAIDHYRIALDQFQSEQAAARLARALDRLGDSEQAGAVLVRFCDAHPEASSSILSETGILFDEMSRFEQGERYHLRALTAALAQNAPHQDALHNNLGYNWIQQKRFAGAQAQFRAALELNPHSQVAHNNLAFALAATPRATEAQTSEALLHWQSTAGPAGAHNNLAAVYMEQNRMDDAKRELGLALGFDRNNPAALRNLGSLGPDAAVPVATPGNPPAVAASNGKNSFWKRIFQNHKRKTSQSAGAAIASAPTQSQSSTIKVRSQSIP